MKQNFNSLKKEKGQVGGVTILIGTVSALFIIGFLVMIYALVGGSLLESGGLYNAQTLAVTNESTGGINASGYTVVNSDLFNARTFVLTEAWDDDGVANYTIPLANLTISSSGVVTNATVTTYGENATVSYTVVYDETTTASDVVNSTISALSTVVTWFSIIIIITVMVVLILLTTLIIRAIRGTGFTGESA